MFAGVCPDCFTGLPKGELPGGGPVFFARILDSEGGRCGNLRLPDFTIGTSGCKLPEIEKEKSNFSEKEEQKWKIGQRDATNTHLWMEAADSRSTSPEWHSRMPISRR